MRLLFSAGFEKPSAIQQRAIMPILKKRDLIAQAQSGTGKSSLISIVALQVCSNFASFCLCLFVCLSVF